MVVVDVLSVICIATCLSAHAQQLSVQLQLWCTACGHASIMGLPKADNELKA